MKKFKNNVLWGVIAMVLNLVILGLVVFSTVELSTYDKKNTYLQDSVMFEYKMWSDSVQYADVAVGNTKMSMQSYKRSFEDAEAAAKRAEDEMEQCKVYAAGLSKNSPEYKQYEEQFKTAYKKWQSDSMNMAEANDNITRLNNDLKAYNDTLTFAQNGLKPWQEKHDEAVSEVAPYLKNFNMVIIITSVLLALKLLCFGIWMMFNTKNLRKVCPWWKKSSDVMNIVSWFIPVYNLFKPCALFSNLISETKYVLRDKSIITDTKDNNHMESISLWWGSMLFAKIVMPLFVGGVAICLNVWLFSLLGFADMNVAQNDLGLLGFGTFFGNTGLFFYLRPHVIILALYLIGWLVYLGYECYMIFSYNKLNKMLCDNEDKFDTDETTVIK